MSVEIVAYDPDWPRRFQERGERQRQALGTVALRIDHIGSTSIPGLAAKPIIDIQISVTDAKNPFIWSVMQRATDWSQDVGWEPGPSDS